MMPQMPEIMGEPQDTDLVRGEDARVEPTRWTANPGVPGLGPNIDDRHITTRQVWVSE